MHVLKVRNVNQALSDGLWWLHAAGEHEASRNGPVRVAPGPVATVYLEPTERVLFNPARDANPYFHFFESLWMLAGHNDVEWPARFAPSMRDYSDNGRTLHGAYGFRWRCHFDYDQLSELIAMLRGDPTTRRAVLTMWDPNVDLVKAGGKDLPCNTHCYLDRRHDALNLTVLCRSNDVVWGAYGANAVHFSFLQEYVAAALQIPVGVMTQVSNNYHLYTENQVVRRLHLRGAGEDVLGAPMLAREHDYYKGRHGEANGGPSNVWIRVEPHPLLNVGAGETIAGWNEDLVRFLSDPEGDTNYNTTFFAEVANPLYASWADRKAKRNDGLLALQACGAEDWALAATQWIQRRQT